MDLRQQVAKALYDDAIANPNSSFESQADLAIAAVLGAMREPSEGMLVTGCDPFDYIDHEDQIAQCWVNMLTTFASEHNVEIGE